MMIRKLCLGLTTLSILLGLNTSPALGQGGVPLWTNRFDPISGVGGYPPAIAVDRNGSVFVAGSTLDSNGIEYDYVTVAYSSSGMLLWTNYYDGPYSGRDIPLAIAATSDGNVVVTGKSWNGYDYTTSDFATVAYSGSGIPLWTNRYDGPGGGQDIAYAVAADNSGNVFVTGRSWDGTFADYATIAYSSAGIPLWTNYYHGLGNGDDEPLAIAVNSRGNVFVTGGSLGASGYFEFATLAYSNAGVPLWTNRFSYFETNNCIGLAIAVDGQGNVFVAGSGGGYTTVAYSNTGAPLWTNTYRGPTDTYDLVHGIAVDPSGNVFVTGESRRGGDTGASADYVTVAYSGAGIPLWTNRYNGPGNNYDGANAIAVDQEGNVFVTGGSYRGSSYTLTDYATVAYSGAGAALWTNRYNGPRNDEDVASGVAVDLVGNVFVTGRSVGKSGAVGFATIKYSSSVHPRLKIQGLHQEVVLTWTNSAFNLQSAPTATGTFTNIPSATSPYTNPITGPQQYFRLSGQ
jgi:hypothetical protein